MAIATIPTAHTDQPGELVEIDVKYAPGRIAGERYFPGFVI